MLSITYRAMLAYFYILASVIFIGGCNRKDAIDHKKVEKVILSQANNSHKLKNVNSYSQYYCSMNKNNILSVFVVHTSSEISTAERLCKARGGGIYPCQGRKSIMVPGGKSAWLNSCDEMPVRTGGGCSYVYIEYDPIKGAVKKLECNGEY